MDFKKYVRAIEIVFENLESVIFHVDLVDSITIKGLKSTFTCNSSKERSRLEDVHHTCDSVELVLKYNQESDLSYYPTYDQEPLLATFVRSFNERSILGRMLHYNNIVSLEFLNGANDVFTHVHVPFEGDMENESMTWHIDKHQKLVQIQIERS